jgi:tRNA threonylcarbamoyladenosine biosynthesis protein TsaB
MRVLAIDCSTEWLAVAAGDEAACVERREHAGQLHSQRVLPLVDALLRERGWTLRALDGIAFGAGPGSFTGIRIACGVVQGLALGASLPVVPIATLEALAQAAYTRHGATRVFTCLDARMREVYVAAYVRHGGAWSVFQPPGVMKPEEVALAAGNWFGAGEGLHAYPGLATSLRLSGHDPTIAPSAQAIVELALPRLAAGEGVDAAHALPLYVRHRVALTSDERAAGVRL